MQEFRSALTPFRSWLFKSRPPGSNAAQERLPREKFKVSGKHRQIAAPELLQLLVLLFFCVLCVLLRLFPFGLWLPAMPLVNPRIVVSSTIGVVIQLALTMLAWGDWSSFFAHPARTWLVIGSFLLLVVAWFTGSSGISGGEKHSASSKTVLYGFFAVILAVVLVPPFCDRRDLWVIDGGTVRYLGLALFFLGSILRLAAVFELGHRFSGLVAIQSDHQLKTDGLYRYIRHPSYTGLLMSMIGFVLVFRSTIGLVLTVFLFLMLLSRMADEEKFLEAHFGSTYQTYRQKTKRLVPLIY